MKKVHYTAPQAELLEAENAHCFLQESPGGSIPELEDSGIEIVW